MEVWICIPAIQIIHNEQDKVRNSKNVPNIDIVFDDRKYSYDDILRAIIKERGGLTKSQNTLQEPISKVLLKTRHWTRDRSIIMKK